MKRPLALLIVVVAACSGQELAPPPTTPPSGPTTTANVTTTTTPVTTTSSVATTTTTTLAPLESLAYEEVALLEFPIHLVGWRDGLSLVATKDGRVWVMERDGTIGESPVLDISGQVTNQGEQGFLHRRVSRRSQPGVRPLLRLGWGDRRIRVHRPGRPLGGRACPVHT